MAKLTCLLALFVAVVVCADAIRIDPRPVQPRRGRHSISQPQTDPRCGEENTKYAIEGDCKKYLKCVGGKGRVMYCTGDTVFDSNTKRCLPPDEADCGKERSSKPVNEEEKCPSPFGKFPVESDCHKYMLCDDGKPRVETCPQTFYYNKVAGGCDYGDCPESYSSEKNVCQKPFQKLPDKKNCRHFIECDNDKKAYRRACKPGTAFDPKDSKCTKEQLAKCKQNDIMSIGQDDH